MFVSPLEPNLKAHTAFLETSGHQNFLGHRSGTTRKKGAFLGAEKLQKRTNGNEREKTSGEHKGIERRI